MTNASGTSGKGLETMKKSKAVPTAAPVDARTDTSTATTKDENDATTTQKAAKTTSTTSTDMTTTVLPSRKDKDSKNERKSDEISPNSSSGGTNHSESSSTSSKMKAVPTPQTKSEDLNATDAVPNESSKSPAFERKNDGGNDRVTVDKKPNKSLTPQSRSIGDVPKMGNTKTDNVENLILGWKKRLLFC